MAKSVPKCKKLQHLAKTAASRGISANRRAWTTIEGRPQMLSFGATLLAEFAVASDLRWLEGQRPVKQPSRSEGRGRCVSTIRSFKEHVQ
jgi:hypothetical protein